MATDVCFHTYDLDRICRILHWQGKADLAVRPQIFDQILKRSVKLWKCERFYFHYFPCPTALDLRAVSVVLAWFDLTIV